MRVYIVEDEQPALQRLKDMLAADHEIEIVGSTGSGRIAAAEIDALKPDLIFLDIHLEDISGIDLPALIKHNPYIIFCTAYDQYAVQAFEIKAVDYLLKPFAGERLQQALQRVREQVERQNPSMRRIAQLLKDWNPAGEYLTRIPSKIGERIFILNVKDIVYFNSDRKLVFAYLFDDQYLINYTLEQLIQRLDPDMFFRIHRSTIVNLEYVKTIETWFAGGYRMTVKDKKLTTLEISRNAGRQLRQQLGW